MPRFEIEQYELHTMRYSVEAADEAQAIKKLLDGGAEAMDDTMELIEVADDHGMPVVENQKLAAGLRALGVEIGEKVIPSIRCIEQID